MQSNARMGGNAAKGGYKPAVKKNGGSDMARVSDRNDWFEIWFQDKQDMINIMSHNMAADLAAGYDYFGQCIAKQRADIEAYKADFDNTVDMFKTMEEKQVNNWCFYDLKKRGAIG